MRAAPVILIYTVAAVVLGAALAPWLFWAVHLFWPNWPFRRVFDRTMLMVAVAGLWPLLRALGVSSWAEIGLRRSPRWWRTASVGVAVGIGSFVVLAVILMALGSRSFESPLPVLFPEVLVFAATGVAVSLIEEIFFRSGVQGALQRATNAPVAILLGSAIYSAAHFFKTKGIDVEASAVTWHSGFAHLGRVAANSVAEPGVGVGFVTLLLAGCVLGVVYVRSGTLYLSIGIHAGWVFTLKCYSLLTANTGVRTWWSGGGLVENLLAWPVLLVLLVTVVVWPWRQEAARAS